MEAKRGKVQDRGYYQQCQMLKRGKQVDGTEVTGFAKKEGTGGLGKQFSGITVTVPTGVWGLGNNCGGNTSFFPL